MKNFLLILAFFSITISCSENGLEGLSTVETLNYKNGNLSTGKVSSTGLVAPQGYELSEVNSPMSISPGSLMYCFYLNFQEKARYYISDDFVIPSNENWNIDNISLNVINWPVYTPSNFPVKKVYIEIYDGNPELATSKKVYGDLDTNIFKSASPTNVYRINSSTTNINDPDNSVLIYKIETAISNLNLKSGHYWFKMILKFDYGEDWSCYVPRLPVEGNNQSSFNAFFKDMYHGTVFTSDAEGFNGAPLVNYEVPFEIHGKKTIQ